MDRFIKKAKQLRGQIVTPPDKSISHRAVIFASLANGSSVIKNFLWAKDPLSSLNSMRLLGVDIEITETKEIVVHGKGLKSLIEPDNVIDCGNSGTTMRLLSGILAGQSFFSVLTGDDSLRQRPMKRIVTPLSLMGATVIGRDGNRLPPLAIKGGSIKGIDYDMPIASAQVKSAILLAGLFAQGKTSVSEPYKSRDHTEKMLKSMGAELEIDGNRIEISPLREELKSLDISIPGDFSSAAFFIAAASLVKDSEVLIKDVCLNNTRTGLMDVLINMGANISVINKREQAGELLGDLLIRSSEKLKGTLIEGNIIPRLIDEFPILCVIASQAEGVTVIKDAKDLRAKESDRIKAMTTELNKMGVDIHELDDGVEIKGPCKIKAAEVYSYKDHRIAMALSIAALIADGETKIKDAECVDISFPEFYNLLEMLQH
ncbi:3-phosphoshikimate 1-carboxyvinyltransferase [Thermodesulfovibrio sp.]|uniref:3-phosphoshikimate 1-carboxyvinyltransferase n=1 Tax=Thermodesulfovibrio sp. TaxID=2067987 RepID=UPI003095A968